LKNGFFKKVQATQSLGIKTLIALAFGISNFLTNSAGAWGIVGHRAIGSIAFQQLDRTAAKELASLLGRTTEENMSNATVWPDRVRPIASWHHTAPYHYTNIEDGMTYLQFLNQNVSTERQGVDVMRAILVAADVISSPVASRDQRIFALKFFVHFVGDLHQPLHTGRPSDRGGNDIKLSYNGKQTNLHSIWDGGILEAAHSADLASLSDFQKGDWYAGFLKSTLPMPAVDVDPMAWIEESRTLRTAAYKGYSGNINNYATKNLAVIEKQVLRAGLRLGAWLNLLLNGKYQEPQAVTKAKNDMRAAIGADYAQFISLEPDPNAFNFQTPRSVDDCDHQH
jgi:hypothetical protein